MKTFLPLLLLLSVAPAFAQDKPKPAVEAPKPVYRTLNKLLKDFRRQAEAKIVAAR
jgi:hypothetical protein